MQGNARPTFNDLLIAIDLIFFQEKETINMGPHDVAFDMGQYLALSDGVIYEEEKSSPVDCGYVGCVLGWSYIIANKGKELSPDTWDSLENDHVEKLGIGDHYGVDDDHLEDFIERLHDILHMTHLNRLSVKFHLIKLFNEYKLDMTPKKLSAYSKGKL